MSSRKRAALARNLSRASLDPDTRSSALSDPATTAGATEFENRYGRERWRSSSTTSRWLATYPPDAPPSAFPSVPVRMSTRSRTPNSSGVPRPASPTNPTAWESSTSTIAPNSSARSQISSSGANEPSIEKTPSVTTHTRRAPPARAASSWLRRSAMSALRYRKRAALERRMPSMIEAWFSSSETIASSAPNSTSKTPPLASKQEL